MIQIDMPMPEKCDVCPFNYDFCWCNAFGNYDEKWEKYRDDWNDHVCDRETRPGYCPLKEIVRCKDCKHRPIKPKDFENGFDLEFPDGKCPCQCDDGWYSWYPPDNWYCADAERKEGR
jgi:hypothetical protein